MDSRKMLLFFIAIAVIMAVAGFLLLQFITQEPEMPPVAEQAPAGETTGQQIEVDGTFVTLQSDPNRVVQIVPQAGPTAVPPTGEPGTGQAEPGDPAPLPTATMPPPTPVPPTATPAPLAPNPNVNPVTFRDHVVGPNDTLYRLTEQYNTSIPLMALHGLAADHMVEGTPIRVPVPNPDYCPGLRPYLVREGDTVFSIAREFATTPDEIRRINSLNEGYKIDIAQILCIP